MQTRNWIVGTAIVLVFAVLIGYLIVRHKSVAPGMSHTDWTQITDDQSGVMFRYPGRLETSYIQAIDWPPRVAVAKGPFTCTEAGSIDKPAGKTEKRTINGHTYCVTTESQGAAGSVYSLYAFATEKEGKVVILSFGTHMPVCGNYDEPLKSQCTKEENSFDVGPTVDSVVSTMVLPQ